MTPDASLIGANPWVETPIYDAVVADLGWDPMKADPE